MFQMSKVKAILALATLAVSSGVDNSKNPPKYDIPGACVNLMKIYNTTNLHRHVTISGTHRRVEVQWGSGPTNHANAAFLVAALKYVHGYKDVALVRGKETLCELAGSLPLYDDADAFDTRKKSTAGHGPPPNVEICKMVGDGSMVVKVVIHVGAKTLIDDWNCTALASCNDARNICSMAGARLNVMGQAMAPVDPQLQAILSLRAQNNPECTERTWTYNSTIFDLKHCDFLPPDPYFFYKHVDEKYRNPKCVNITCGELLPSCASVLTKLNLSDIFYNKFINHLAERLRHDHSVLQLWTPQRDICLNSNYSYLLLEQPYQPRPAFRVADGALLRQFAPIIFDVVKKFAPSQFYIKGVLKFKMNTSNIEEAACQFAEVRNFGRWVIASDNVLWVYLLLCKGDPDNKWYNKIASIVGSNIGDFSIVTSEINCSDVNDFNQKLFQKSRDMRWANMIGIVGQGAGAALVADAASNMETQVMLYDVPPDTANLTCSARTATGRVKPLALALNHFLKENGWRRIAIISDRTQLAEDFSKALRDDPTLSQRERFLDGEDFKTRAVEILLNFREESASGRIFFVNTNSKAAGELLCAAFNLGMTENEHYAWIVREWGRPACDMTGIRHFTVTYWWRGGNYSSLPPEASKISNLSKTIDQQFLDSVWPPLVAPLVDAITLMSYETKAALQTYPELRYDLHSFGNTRKISESFSQGEAVSGILQSLKQRDYSLEQPLVFVYAWPGRNLDLLAVWRVENQTVHVLSTIHETYPERSPPSDGSMSCATVTTGDQYDPSCYDAAIFSAIALVAITLFLLYLGNRYRMKMLEQKFHMLQVRLLARSERTAEALGPYLVSRSSLDIRQELGMGNFGRVHFGMLTFPKQTIPVAVKSLREEASLAEESQFLHEACVLSRLSHVNIVRLVGVCAADGPPLVMMEYAFHCDLCRYLTSRRHYAEVKDSETDENNVTEASSICPRELTRFVREAALALDYLSFKKIVHRDVRAANCLIDDRRMLKLADFGMARQTISSRNLEDANEPIQSSRITSRESYNLKTVSEPLDYSYFCKRRRDKFPVTWMAPESIARGEFSSASDVWSLGVMIFEIVMLGQRPFGSWSPQRVYQYMIIGGIPQLPLEISYSSREAIEMCWWKQPRKRATAAAVRTHLTANPTAIKHAVAARAVGAVANETKTVKTTNTGDSGYSEKGGLMVSNDPRISTF